MQFQLADLFECLCDARPEAEAVVAGPQRRSRGELDARANRLAHHLASCGIRRGDRVGVYAHNRVEWAETLLACWKLGAAAVNVNFRYVPAELGELWQDAAWSGLVYERGFAPAVGRTARAMPPLLACLVLEDGSPAADAPGEDFEAALAAAPAGRGFAPRSADDLHLVWTGGTTGRPKGVVWRHEDLFFNVSGPLARGLARPEDLSARAGDPFGLRTLVLSPLMHGGGQFPLLLAVLHGGAAILPASRRFDPQEALDLIERERARAVSLIGDAMARPLAEARLAAPQDFDTRSLRMISSGGAVLSEPVRELLRRAFGDVFVTGGVGSTEIGSAARETAVRDPLAGPRFALDPTVAVLDEGLEPIAPGSGRIGRLARSGHIPLGYWRDPAKSAEAFPTDRRGVRWAVPGDLARVEDDGSITLLGRGPSCINSGGEKIFPDEVEAALVRHPAVRHAAVFGLPDPTWGERVVALVEVQEGETPPSLEDLRGFCRDLLAGYKLPRALVLGPLERTPAGKVDQARARRRAEAALQGGAGEPGP